MSGKLMIVLTAIGIVGASAAGSALAEPYRGYGQAGIYGPNVPAYVRVGYAVADGWRYADWWGYASRPRYHGGPKNSW